MAARWRTVVGLVALAVSVLAALALSAGTTSDGGLRVVVDDADLRPRSRPVTVTPDTGLTHGEAVEVAGAGFAPGVRLGVVTCRVGVTGGRPADHCDRSRVHHVDADHGGRFATTYPAARFISTPLDGPVDCAVGRQACVVAVGTAADVRAGAALVSFVGSGPAPTPEPVIEVAPAEGLADGQEVAVSGRGFTPGAHVWLGLCVAVAGQPAEGGCRHGAGPVAADDEGRVAAALTLPRHLGGAAGQVDCAVAPGRCLLVAVADRMPAGGGVVVGLGFAE